MRYWLAKSEPSVFSIDDLARVGREVWDGVRNYQARNHLRAMAVGDLVFCYHSNAVPPGIAGLMRVSRADIVDPTQFDERSDYFDARSKRDDPRWRTAEMEFVAKWEEFLPLERLKAEFTPEELELVRRGTRLSVIPVEAPVARRIAKLAGEHLP